MSEKKTNQTIRLKSYISENDYQEINQLEDLCRSHDRTNLKLELDYKLHLSENAEKGITGINEFLFYVDDILVSYLGISSFGGSHIGEIIGMTHPYFRRKGFFKQLFELAISECQKRSFKKILLLSDGQSNSGVEFINSAYGQYDFSEYRMKCLNKTPLASIHTISLRKAGKLDAKEIGQQDAIFFNHSEECESILEKEESLNKITYMIELHETTIGKIKVSYSDHSAFISAFGILPSFRSKGYGKAALTETLHLINEKNIYEIELDVECKNNTALKLYKACGFEEKSVMHYYMYNI